jgi:hypothetical protein
MQKMEESAQEMKVLIMIMREGGNRGDRERKKEEKGRENRYRGRES